jgi:hypothetical protein
MQRKGHRAHHTTAMEAQNRRLTITTGINLRIVKVSAQTIATPSRLTSKAGEQHYVQNATRLSDPLS